MNNLLSKLQTVDYVIVAVYLLILLYIGYRASFGKKKKKEEEVKANTEKEVSEAEDESQVQIPPPTSTPEVPEMEVIQID